MATRFWFTICHCFPIMSSHSLSFKWLLRLSALYYIACIIRTTTVASRKIHILCIKFKIRTLWLLTQLYMMVAFWKKVVCNSVSLLVFSTRLSLPESAYLSEIVIRVHVIKTYPSLCDKTSLTRHCLFYACIKSV